jgi:hypothetical protein
LRGVCVEMEGGGGCGVGGGGGGGHLHEVTEEKVIDGIVHPFACRAWACAPARHDEFLHDAVRNFPLFISNHLHNPARTRARLETTNSLCSPLSHNNVIVFCALLQVACRGGRSGEHSRHCCTGGKEVAVKTCVFLVRRGGRLRNAQGRQMAPRRFLHLKEGVKGE